MFAYSTPVLMPQNFDFSLAGTGLEINVTFAVTVTALGAEHFKYAVGAKIAKEMRVFGRHRFARAQ
jgi:hypothetical protein